MSPSPPEQLGDLLTGVVDGAGLVLEDVAITPAGKRRVVRVVVDLPEDRTGALDLDAVAEVSRAVADALDSPRADQALGGQPFVLEVTTPGVDRPLTGRRHWARARGRLVSVPVGADAGSEVTGRVTAVDDDGVALDVDGAARRVAWDELGTGRMQVEMSRPGDTDQQGDDTGDTDEPTDDAATEEF